MTVKAKSEGAVATPPPVVGGRIRVTFEADGHDGIIAWAKDLLEWSGYVVKPKEHLRAKETPSQFAARLGIAAGTFSRKIRLAGCPQNFEAGRGEAGRIVWLKASSELEEFMSSPIGGDGNA